MLPILLAMLLAVLSLGMLFTVDLVITNACREGARFGAIGKSKAEVEERVTDYLEQARLKPASASIDVAGAGGASGTDISVGITYPVQLYIPVPGLPNPVEVRSWATMRIE